MQLISHRSVPATVEATWAALNDPEMLKACIPGCESVERTSDHEFKIAMTARVGPVAARFNGRIALSDVVPPSSYRMSFEGQGGAAGFARGDARIALVADEVGTRIDYSATAQVGGKLAQIGSRLVDAAAAKVADDFFACFVERLGGQARAARAPVLGGRRALGWRLGLAIAIIVVVTIYWLMRRG
ncbi:MAG TPA: carbon monoxide dehydrogenase subunit G [Casimicrobiaceae bacterium]|nr:carbon monoxide dehydrogenase subunit G [Casimicrobiaceae bacterium]